MQTILVGLVAGFIIGVISIVYVLLRTNKVISVGHSSRLRNSNSMPYSRSLTSSGLMVMTVAGSGSMLWGFIGAGIYHIIQNDLYFFSISTFIAIVLSFIILNSNTTFAKDKVVVCSIIFVGLGFLIPYMI